MLRPVLPLAAAIAGLHAIACTVVALYTLAQLHLLLRSLVVAEPRPRRLPRLPGRGLRRGGAGGAAMILLALALAVPLGPGDLPVGTTLRSDHTTALDLDLDVRLLGRPQPRSLIRRHHQVSELTAASNGLHVRWTTHQHRALEPGHAHDRILPVVGPTYRLDGDRVSRLDGIAPSEEEVAIVRQVQLPGQLRAIREALGEDPEPGDVLPAPSLFAGILDDAPGEPELVGGTLRFERVEEGRAHFAVDLHLRSTGRDDKGTTIVTDAQGQGELVVDVASGRTTRLALAGTVAVEAHRADLDTTGAGTFTTLEAP